MENIDWKSFKFYLIPNYISETLIVRKGELIAYELFHFLLALIISVWPSR